MGVVDLAAADPSGNQKRLECSGVIPMIDWTATAGG